MNDSFGTGNPSPERPVDELSYEQARDELIETVKILELGQMGLDESLKYWERGEALAKRCEQHLDRANRRVDEAMSARNSAGDESGAQNRDSDTDHGE